MTCEPCIMCAGALSLLQFLEARKSFKIYSPLLPAMLYVKSCFSAWECCPLLSVLHTLLPQPIFQRLHSRRAICKATAISIIFSLAQSILLQT